MRAESVGLGVLKRSTKLINPIQLPEFSLILLVTLLFSWRRGQRIAKGNQCFKWQAELVRPTTISCILIVGFLGILALDGLPWFRTLWNTWPDEFLGVLFLFEALLVCAFVASFRVFTVLISFNIAVGKYQYEEYARRLAEQQVAVEQTDPEVEQAAAPQIRPR